MWGAQRLSCYQQFSECRLNFCQVTGYSFIFINHKFGIPIQFKNIHRALIGARHSAKHWNYEGKQDTIHDLKAFRLDRRETCFKTKAKQTQTHKQNSPGFSVIIIMKKCVRAGTVSVFIHFASFVPNTVPQM